LSSKDPKTELQFLALPLQALKLIKSLFIFGPESQVESSRGCKKNFWRESAPRPNYVSKEVTEPEFKRPDSSFELIQSL
jgi:hypothetical protein